MAPRFRCDVERERRLGAAERPIASNARDPESIGGIGGISVREGASPAWDRVQRCVFASLRGSPCSGSCMAGEANGNGSDAPIGQSGILRRHLHGRGDAVPGCERECNDRLAQNAVIDVVNGANHE